MPAEHEYAVTLDQSPTERDGVLAGEANGDEGDSPHATVPERLCCPLEHAGDCLHRRNGTWFCRACESAGIAPWYSYVRDRRTRAFVAPGEQPGNHWAERRRTNPGDTNEPKAYTDE